MALYHLLTSPETLRKLKAELKSIIPPASSYTPLAELEQLQYLSAVIKETLRLSYGVPSRLYRVSPDKTLIFAERSSGKQWVIPPGTAVAMSTYLIHHDESIFPESYKFLPERWLDPTKPRLDQYLVSFTKGTRQCLGMNLAYAELYIGLSAIFSRFGSGGKGGVRDARDEGVLELYETGLSDVEMARDYFLPFAAKGSQGVRIKVKD